MDSKERPEYSKSLSCDSSATRQNELAEEEQRLKNRRRLIVLSIVAIFVVATTIMIVSVVHDVSKSNDAQNGITELTCSDGDAECLQLLCPEGYKWNLTESRCHKLPGKECCFDELSMLRCWSKEDGMRRGNSENSGKDDEGVENSQNGAADEINCVDTTGVVPGSYRELCRPGYLWVEWRGKCFIKN